LALLQCGARVLPLNPQLPEVLLQELLPALNVQHQLVLNGAALPGDLQALTLQAAEGVHTVCWHGERLVSMTLTSGSTGLPKAAVHSASAHLASAAGVLALMPFAAEDDWLLSLPLFHVSGQGIIWRWLLAGARM
ncbi:AMP-binding protein, partial [Klebsiella pneumoniae]|uniref:AMP-binding protein n=1 Tax=Klebsiella pneumoniae TaxID=573 RepID=UPI00115E1605